MRRAHQGHVVAERGGVFGEAQGFDGGLDASGSYQDLFRGGGFADGFEDVAAFLVGEQDGFSGGTLDDDAGDGRARVALDVVLDLFVINLAVGVERRGDGGEDSV